jgi:hypothetical protein
VLIEQILIQLVDEHTNLARNQYQSKQKEVNEVNNTHIHDMLFNILIYQLSLILFSLEIFNPSFD